MTDRFINKNRELWSRLPISDKGPKILIEEVRRPFSMHILAVYGVLLNLSKKYQPVWIGDMDDRELQTVRSYIPTASTVQHAFLNAFEKKLSIAIALWHYFLLKMGKKVINLNLFGIKYGDILYDQYLRKHQLATIKVIDRRILDMMKTITGMLFRYKKLIKNGEYEAVLVSHRIGLTDGLLTRIAAKHNLEVYSTGGQHYGTILRTTTYDDVISYVYKPTNKELQTVVSLDNFDTIFKDFLEKHKTGVYSKDAAKAFADESNNELTTEIFANKLGLDVNKKNVFVMLHAFTDFPHSHFKRVMIFKDYLEWVTTTLNYAKTDTEVNWIFKQHPSVEFYPTKDVDYDALFSAKGDHIVYLDVDQRINTFDVARVADVIITCVGSAGFEIPALGGKAYSITPSPNYYNNIGFAKYPKSIKAYIDMLKAIPNEESLTEDDQRVAQALFLYVNEFAKVKVSAIPNLTHSSSRDTNMNNWYWEMVADEYDKHQEVICQEALDYAEQMKADDFWALRSF